MNPAVPDLPTQADAVHSPYQQDVLLWLQGHDMLAHWWTPQDPLLEEGFQTLRYLAETQGIAISVRVFQPDELLLLLRSVNAQIAASGAQDQIARTEQLWILPHAERVATDQLDILRRIVLQYPELGIRMAFFSVASESPPAVYGVHLAPIHFTDENPSLPGSDTTPLAPQSKRWWPWYLLTGLVLIAAGGWWMREQIGVVEHPRSVEVRSPQAAPAATEASEIASAMASSRSPDASDVASSESPTPHLKAPVDPVAMSASRRWLLSLPQDSLLVVHAELESVRAAESFRAAGQPVLTNARIVMTEARDDRTERYLVVTAPFRSAERAQSYIQRLQWKAQARAVTREALLQQTPR